MLPHHAGMTKKIHAQAPSNALKNYSIKQVGTQQDFTRGRRKKSMAETKKKKLDQTSHATIWFLHILSQECSQNITLTCEDFEKEIHSIYQLRKFSSLEASLEGSLW